jgi:glyoxylate carboligase
MHHRPAPRARLHKEDFQAVDIESIAKPVSKMAVTVREAALVPGFAAGISCDALWSSWSGIDRFAF